MQGPDNFYDSISCFQSFQLCGVLIFLLSRVYARPWQDTSVTYLYTSRGTLRELWKHRKSSRCSSGYSVDEYGSPGHFSNWRFPSQTALKSLQQGNWITLCAFRRCKVVLVVASWLLIIHSFIHSFLQQAFTLSLLGCTSTVRFTKKSDTWTSLPRNFQSYSFYRVFLHKTQACSKRLGDSKSYT